VDRRLQIADHLREQAQKIRIRQTALEEADRDEESLGRATLLEQYVDVLEARVKQDLSQGVADRIGVRESPADLVPDGAIQRRGAAPSPPTAEPTTAASPTPEPGLGNRAEPEGFTAVPSSPRSQPSRRRRPVPRKLDPVNGPLRDRLEYHYRTNFPGFVRRLDKEALRKFLTGKEGTYRSVLGEQVQNNLAFHQAEELAFEAAFDRPPSPSQDEPEPADL
jgi:hypothetical protein